jgi:hypothetical protein
VAACPDEVVEAVEDKVVEHLERLGKALGKGASLHGANVKATLNVLTKFQGVKVSVTREATDKIVTQIVKVYRQ